MEAKRDLFSLQNFDSLLVVRNLRFRTTMVYYRKFILFCLFVLGSLLLSAPFSAAMPHHMDAEQCGIQKVCSSCTTPLVDHTIGMKEAFRFLYAPVEPESVFLKIATPPLYHPPK